MMSFESVEITTKALDQMMPMHLILNEMAIITHAGPTIEKVLGFNPVGMNGFTLFEPRRPRVVTSIEEVRALGGSKINLRILDEHRTSMVGAVTVLPGDERVLMNLSFGYCVIEAVARYQLAGSDFAPTDLTLEMLYLMEAKTAAMEATSNLAHRLHDEKAVAQIEAMTDGLTRLKNRRASDLAFARMLERGRPFTLMQLDLDFFKTVNDTLGHAAGDTVLRTVADILLCETRDTDIVARVGGDEFVIMFENLANKDSISRIATRIIEKLEKPIPYNDHECRISVSIGIVFSTDYTQENSERMCADADGALYASKRKGRACYTIFRPEPTCSKS